MATSNSLARDWVAWLVMADRLKRAADLVGSRFQSDVHAVVKATATQFAAIYDRDPKLAADEEEPIYPFELALPAFMLAGYAIEVLAKALIAAKGTDEDVDWMTRQHISTELLTRAGVHLSGAEGSLVEKQLYHAVRWSGRYPFPLERDNAKLQEQIGTDVANIFTNPLATSTDHYRQASELFDRLRADLLAAMGKPSNRFA